MMQGLVGYSSDEDEDSHRVQDVKESKSTLIVGHAQTSWTNSLHVDKLEARPP